LTIIDIVILLALLFFTLYFRHIRWNLGRQVLTITTTCLDAGHPEV
jgi:hypothetical protein